MTPTFLCIGGQRCGTTWLHAVLGQLPQVFVCPEKETDYFNANILRQGLAEYERRFDPPPDRGPCPVRGELSPNYCILKRPAIEVIRRLYPRLRLLLVIRDPVERTLSQAWLDRRYMSGQARRAPLSLGEYLRHLERQRTRRRNDYARVIEDWRAAFGREALHVELYDDLCTDPAAFLRRVLRHLGADDRAAPPAALLQRKVFESTKSFVPPLVRWYLARDYRESVRRLNELLQGRVSHWLRAMDQTMAHAPLSWRLTRALNKYVLSVPEKAAYAAYDAWRDRQLMRRGREVVSRRMAEQGGPSPPEGPPKTGFCRGTVQLSVH